MHTAIAVVDEAAASWIVLLLALATGVRLGEVPALRWHNLDFDWATIAIVEMFEQTKGAVQFTRPKGGHGHNVTLPSFAVVELRDRTCEQTEAMLRLGVRQNDDTPARARSDGQMPSPDGLSHALGHLIRRLGLPRIRFHDLRPPHASHLLSAGIHRKVVQETLGDTAITLTLDTYSYVLAGLRDEAAAKFDSMLGRSRQNEG